MSLNLGEVAAVTAIIGTLCGFALYVIRGEIRGEVASDVARIDGRMSGHEKECLEFRKRIDERHEATAERANHQHDEVMRAIADLRHAQAGFYHQRATDPQ
jgi:hypothetical protein